MAPGWAQRAQGGLQRPVPGRPSEFGNPSHKKHIEVATSKTVGEERLPATLSLRLLRLQIQAYNHEQALN